MKLAIVNQSKRVSASEMTKIRSAMRLQARQFCPLWNMLQPTITINPTSDSITLLVVDNADMAGALGYHDVDSNGKPYGRVFVDPVLDNGGSVLGTPSNLSLSVSAVVSHEFMEWAADPLCTAWMDAGRQSVALEVADPVENDAYNVLVGNTNVAVSNFILPAWFNIGDKVGPFDYLHKLSKPFTMTAGGYEIVMSDGQPKQVFASSRAEFARLGAASALAPTKHFPASRTFRRLQTEADS